MFNLQTYNEAIQRINAVIDGANVIDGDAPAVNSHNRLMRIQAISGHVISEVIPNIADVEARNAMAVWLVAIHDITRAGEFAVQGERL